MALRQYLITIDHGDDYTGQRARIRAALMEGGLDVVGTPIAGPVTELVTLSDADVGWPLPIHKEA